jgi:hypothetical protein
MVVTYSLRPHSFVIESPHPSTKAGIVQARKGASFYMGSKHPEL